MTTARSWTSGRDGCVVLEIADRGSGVPAAERSQIFKPFFRGEEGVSRARSGTGLGLTLVQRIVEAHGGSVTVQERDGGGSIFAVTLPQSNG